MTHRTTTLIQPPRLQPGDTIALIAPASHTPRERVEKGIAFLERAGFVVQHRADLFATHRYFAGDDARRAAELEDALCDPTIRAIFCVRGGYGVTRILPRLSLERLRRDATPKIILGYSDLTALHSFVHQHLGWHTFYGPTVAYHLGFVAEAPENWENALHAVSSPIPLGTVSAPNLRVIKPGTARGPLLGGCLTLVHASLATSYAPNLTNAILFLEDRGEKIYALDRMLTHLTQSDTLRDVRGILFGDVSLAADEPHPEYFDDIVREIFEGFPGPILAGLPAGHCDPCLTFPLGALTEISCDPLQVVVHTSGVRA